jgi:hypothetical protein
VREQIVKRLPAIPVGMLKHLSLVNVEDLMWTPTPAVRDLGTITVIGQPVRVRLDFDHADWSFGDNTTAQPDTPGKVYDPAAPCATKQCPDYFGHTYLTRGPRTITMTINWKAQYSLNNGTTWTTITGGPIPGPTTNTTITVKEAYTILIDPGR